MEIESRGHEAVVLELPYDLNPDTPFWQLHAGAVARDLNLLPEDRVYLLVAHSGAGMLLPAIRQLSSRPVAGYIFVEADIPEHGKSRLDLLRSALPQLAEATDTSLAEGELLPKWSEEDLREAVPDAELRRTLLAGLRPHPMAYLLQPIPVFAGWPDAPCGYLRFGSNPAYELASQKAWQAGWACLQIEGEHFHMLVDPAAVAEALLQPSRAWKYKDLPGLNLYSLKWEAKNKAIKPSIQIT